MTDEEQQIDEQWRQAKLKDIEEHPENHRHDFGGLRACCVTPSLAIDISVMDAHPALGYNGGMKCDVTSGPCACGAWHLTEEEEALEMSTRKSGDSE